MSCSSSSESSGARNGTLSLSSASVWLHASRRRSASAGSLPTFWTSMRTFFPAETPENRYREPLRYLAIRILKKQQELFADGSTVKHFAVATNLWDWAPKKLLQWHREKAGSIEAAHNVIKNELAGGVMPCGRFGSNAAWLRFGETGDTLHIYRFSGEFAIAERTSRVGEESRGRWLSGRRITSRKSVATSSRFSSTMPTAECSCACSATV